MLIQYIITGFNFRNRVCLLHLRHVFALAECLGEGGGEGGGLAVSFISAAAWVVRMKSDFPFHTPKYCKSMHY